MTQKKHNNITKCKSDGFWRDDVIKKGLQNWIKQKYQYDTIIKFLDNHIIIQFIGTNQSDYLKIIDDVCQQYNMEPCSVFKGCQKIDETIFKTYMYELRRKHVNK